MGEEEFVQIRGIRGKHKTLADFRCKRARVGGYLLVNPFLRVLWSAMTHGSVWGFVLNTIQNH